MGEKWDASELGDIIKQYLSKLGSKIKKGFKRRK
jgi:hypothetical protein